VRTDARRVLRRGRQRQQLSCHGRPRCRVDGGFGWGSTLEEVAYLSRRGLRVACLVIRPTGSLAALASDHKSLRLCDLCKELGFGYSDVHTVCEGWFRQAKTGRLFGALVPVS